MVERAGEPFDAGARAPEHGGQDEGAHRAAALLGGTAVLRCRWWLAIGFWILKPEYIRLLWTDPVGSKFLTYAIISEIVGILVIRKMANRRYEETACYTGLFFFHRGVCHADRAVSGRHSNSVQTQEDPLGDRLEELQSQRHGGGSRRTSGARRAAVSRTASFTSSASIPGGEDWMHGHGKELAQAGIRNKQALAGIRIRALLFAVLCAAAGCSTCSATTRWLQLLGGMVAGVLLGFMLPKQVLHRLVKRYRRKLQERCRTRWICWASCWAPGWRSTRR